MFVWTIKSFFDKVQFEGIPKKPVLMKFPDLSSEASLKTHKDFYEDMKVDKEEQIEEDEID